LEFKDKETELSEDLFITPEFRKLFALIKEPVRSGMIEPADVVTQIKEVELQKSFAQLLVEPIRADDREKYFRDISKRMKEFQLQRQINNLKKQLDDPELLKDEKTHFALFDRLQKLEAEKRQLKAPPAC
jgi:uncharacterized protein YlxW (UPF0749 family)